MDVTAGQLQWVLNLILQNSMKRFEVQILDGSVQL